MLANSGLTSLKKFLQFFSVFRNVDCVYACFLAGFGVFRRLLVGSHIRYSYRLLFGAHPPRIHGSS